MQQTLSLDSSLYNRLLAADHTRLRKAVMILAGVLLLTFSAQLSLPWQPVPLTFQTATVMLIGMALGARHGIAIVAAYLGAGILGAPVFANFSGGLPILLGPSGGYLAAFLPAVYLVGTLSEKGCARHPITSFLAALAGTALMFTTGIAMLSLYVGIHQAIALGLMPFIISEPMKLIALAAVAPQCWRSRER